jgi:hypothetical protein
MRCKMAGSNSVCDSMSHGSGFTRAGTSKNDSRANKGFSCQLLLLI